MILIENLYENIFLKYANDFEELDIITGYASGTFLKKIVDDFTHLKINLYIGMYKEGVSKDNHHIYTELTRESSVKVYYQIFDKPTHMKIYRFRKKDKSLSFIGSPNFSENGFEYNNEILTFVDEINEQVFQKQANNSVICTAENIEEFITIYDNASKIEESIINEVSATYTYGSGRSKTSMSKSMPLLLNKLYTRRNMEFYKKFTMSVVLPPESDVSWYYKGINSENPYIKQNNQVKFSEVFPSNSIFQIYAPDHIFECEIGGRYYSNLYFINVNIYDYFAQKIGLTYRKPIDANTLEEFGLNKMVIERINELEYILDFEK